MTTNKPSTGDEPFDGDTFTTAVDAAADADLMDKLGIAPGPQLEATEADDATEADEADEAPADVPVGSGPENADPFTGAASTDGTENPYDAVYRRAAKARANMYAKQQQQQQQDGGQ